MCTHSMLGGLQLPCCLFLVCVLAPVDFVNNVCLPDTNSSVALVSAPHSMGRRVNWKVKMKASVKEKR